MRKLFLTVLILCYLAIPVSAAEFTAPTAPESAQEWMPETDLSFTEGLLEILSKVLSNIQPSVAEGVRVCVQITAAVLLVSLVRQFQSGAGYAADLTGTIVIGLILLGASQSMVALGTETVTQISDYGKLLLPVMASAMAASGSATASAGLYLGTAFFDSLLSSAISAALIPLIYVFLALSAANCALGEDLLKQMKDFVKWLITWILKTLLYIFTGYMGITGVVSGTTDTATLKAAKLTISGMVPVVGSILSDASEAVLVSAELVKNAAGVYGLLAILSIWIGPFLKIGAQYLLLKLTGSVCGIFGTKAATQLIHDFTAAMGFLLAMTGAVCLMLLISTVCFMKGLG